MSDLEFISNEDLHKHVANTINRYKNKLKPYDLKYFNRNIVDPVKLLFDKSVYNKTWDEIISNEIFRQKDKTDNNEIGYFHQYIFKYIENCVVPPNGKNGGWDIIVDMPQGYILPSGNTVHQLYVELKNKHNTMNSSSTAKTFIKMQDKILTNDNCACMLVEAIAKSSQNIKWAPSVDGLKISNEHIRRVSIDEFYKIVTNRSDAFYQLCKILPSVISDVLKEDTIGSIPNDTVYEELKTSSLKYSDLTEEDAMVLAIYMLGFSDYIGFNNEKIESGSLK